jgi:hypothetical protein
MLDNRGQAQGRLQRRTVLLLAGCVLAAATASANGGGGDRPKVTAAVRVNAQQALFPNDNPTRNSTTIAASEDGDKVLVGFEDFQGFCGAPSNLACPPQNPPGLSGYAFSTNGGQSFTDAGSFSAIGTLIPSGHPWVDRMGRDGHGDGDGHDNHGKNGHDDQGDHDGHHGHDRDTFFFATLLRSQTNGVSGGLGVYRGHFGSANFIVDDGQVIAPPHAGDLYSREAIAASKDGSDSAYLVLANIDQICNVPAAGFGQIELWRTHDGGDSWQGPAVVSPETSVITDPNDPQCGNDGKLQVAPAVAIGTRGEVYVVWQYGPRFYLNANNVAVNDPTNAVGFARSLDGGVTFSAPAAIAPLNAMRDNPPVGYALNRMNDQPRITVATSGRYRGRIYVTFYPAVAPVSGATTAQSLVSSQAYMIYSDDRGSTWSSRVALAPPVPPTGVKRFWPTPSVRPNGDVDVVYMESQETATGTTCSAPIGGAMRIGPVSSLVNTYWVQSRNGGATFGAPVRVSSETSNWCTPPYKFASFNFSNFGAYIGSVSIEDQTLSVWPDDRNAGPVDVLFATIKGDQHGDHDH